MKELLDTSVILGTMPDDVTLAGVSVVTIAELDFGVLQARDPAQRERRRAWRTRTLQRFEPLPVDLPIAEHWAKLAALTASRGRQPRRRAMDLLIAATAQVHGLTLLTADEDLLWLADVMDVRAV